jgi:cytidylate kinase
MSGQLDLERCLSFINCQLQPAGKPLLRVNALATRRAVTISRQAGCGALAVGQKLAEYLQTHAGKDTTPWTVFDRDLVKKVLEDHDLPKRLESFMPEDRVSQIADILEEMFGLHPPSWFLVKQTADTILHLAELGNVILIGRASNIVTAKLEHVVHVRLVGSFEKRLKHVQEFNHLNRRQAADFIRERDGGRRRYVNKYFRQNIDNPLLYHLIINTDFVPCDNAARIIAKAVLSNLPGSAPERQLEVTGPTRQI